MIHIAPCSCELHQALREALERNRELEAKMAMFVNTPNNWLLEKDRMLTRIHELSARVRELEAELKKEQLANRILRSPIYEGAAAGSIELAQRAVEAAERAKARAEKAEMLLRNASAQIGIMRNNNDELKARVAELEALGERAALLMPDDSQWLRDWRGRVGDETPSPGVHEREEC